MKAEIGKAEDQFEPVALTLTFESQKEINVFFETHNISGITDAQREVLGCKSGNSIDYKVRDALSSYVNRQSNTYGKLLESMKLRFKAYK